MTSTISLKQFTLDVWLLEQLKNTPGLTLDELQQRWLQNPNHEGVLSRATLTRHRQMIESFFGVVIHCPDKKHYAIKNPETLCLDTLANELLASVQEYLFLDEFRDLGPTIQPSQIWAGLEYLHLIGDALRHKKKLRIRYQKFSDEQPYDAIVHPYCLKASLGRWYVVGFKENNEHGSDVQAFALDRARNITKLDETFAPNSDFNPETYFKDSFGVWVNKETHPVRDITIAVTPYVAKYLRTLPLHHSQKELTETHPDGRVLFTFHISLTPDFIGELRRWGEGLEIFNIE